MLLIRTPEDARELRLHLPSSIFKKVGLNDCTIQAQFWATFRPQKSGPEWQGSELLGLITSETPEIANTAYNSLVKSFQTVIGMLVKI